LRVSVVVPTYNERDTLPLLLRRLGVVIGRPQFDAEAVVVDDSSPDGTGEVAAALGVELRDVLPVVVLTRPGKAGLASAVIDGSRRARGDVLVIMDSDLSHPPEVVPALLGAIAGGADIAVGSRHIPGGSIASMPPERRALSWGATRLARVLLGIQVRDPMSGLFACRRSLFEGVAFEGIGYKLLLELLVACRGARIVEIPYRFEERAAGTSKLGGGEILNYVRLLGRLWSRRRAGRQEDAAR
jgi:dolichol-phosphate mannosyltransferase